MLSELKLQGLGPVCGGGLDRCIRGCEGGPPRCNDMGYQFVVAISNHGGFNLFDLILQKRLYALGLHTMTTHLELCVQAPAELDLVGDRINAAAVPCAVETTVGRMVYEALSGHPGEVAVAPGQVAAGDAQLAGFAPW